MSRSPPSLSCHLHCILHPVSAAQLSPPIATTHTHTHIRQGELIMADAEGQAGASLTHVPNDGQHAQHQRNLAPALSAGGGAVVAVAAVDQHHGLALRRTAGWTAAGTQEGVWGLKTQVVVTQHQISVRMASGMQTGPDGGEDEARAAWARRLRRVPVSKVCLREEQLRPPQRPTELGCRKTLRCCASAVPSAPAPTAGCGRRAWAAPCQTRQARVAVRASVSMRCAWTTELRPPC